MSVCTSIFFLAFLLIVETTSARTIPSETPPNRKRSGFFIPDTVREMTVRYKNIRNLIVLPMVLNDSIRVNLILDTGCRTLVLFGNRFSKLLSTERFNFPGMATELRC
jgi:hypothetical protein